MNYSINQIAHPKKGSKVTAAHYGLFFNKGRYHGKQVPASEVMIVLKQCVNRGTKRVAQAKAAIDDVTSEQDELTVIKGLPDSKIVEEFSVARKDGRIVIDTDDFIMRGNYLPKDDNAPDRIYAIFCEYKDLIEEFLDIKAKLAETEITSIDVLTIVQDDADQWFLAMAKAGTDDVEIITDSTVKVEEFVKSIFHYGEEVPVMQAQNHVKAEVLKGKKYLKNAKLQFNPQGEIVVTNLEDYNAEVQTVVTELHNALKQA